jgi:type II secretory pathway pseudopilin PulG
MAARRDRGETLVELLVTVVVFGTAVVALVAGLATAVRMSDVHRKQATAGTYVRALAEKIEAAVAATPMTGYQSCASANTYAGLYPVPAPYQTEVIVAYWDGVSAFTGTCTTDMGVQRLTLRVTATNSQVSETLDIIIRRPCRPSEVDAECV